MSNRSSILSFSTLKGALRVPKAGVAALVMIALVNLACVLLRVEERLPTPYFPRHEISKKYMTFREYERNGGGRADVLFIGSSIADMGFDALAFEETLREKGVEHSAFNFGINGAGPWVFRNLIEHVVVPDTDVRYIVYGISMVELNSTSPYFREDQELFMDSFFLEGERDAFPPRGILKRGLFEHFGLLRIRDTLWPSLYTEEEDTWLKLSMRGELFKYPYKGQQRIDDINRNWYYARRRPLVKRRVERLSSLLGDYDPKGYNREHLIGLIELCREKGLTLLLVNMPVIQDPALIEGTVYEKMISDGNGGNPSKVFDSEFRRICAGYDVECLDYGGGSGLPVTDFSDPLHLYHTGAGKLGADIAGFFIEKGWTEGGGG